MLNDLRYAVRILVKSPGFTIVAVASLALSIGANTAIFSLANAILLRSLPVPNPQELRELQWSGAGWESYRFTGRGFSDGPDRQGGDSFSYPAFRALREQCAAQADIFGYTVLDTITARTRGETFTAEGLMVSDNFFSGFGIRPMLGRALGAADERAGAEPAVVISHRWWERQFNLDSRVLGQSVTLNGKTFTIIGVLPREFSGVNPSAQTEFYVSMAAQPQLNPEWSRTSPKDWWMPLTARIKPGVSDRQFQTALEVAFARGTETIIKQTKIMMTAGRAGPDGERNHYREPLLLLLGVVGVVLLVACANLAGLSLARGTARQHELAVRTAIGAARWRLVRQSLTESGLIALIGAGLGLVLALWCKTVISRLLAGSPEGLHYDTSLDFTVLGFTLAITLVTTLLSGVLPALRAASVQPVSALKEGTTRGAPRLSTGKFLVTVQIALSMLLLVGAGLYVRTLVNLVRINPGFATENLLLFRLNPGNAGYKGQRITTFYEDVQRSLAAILGVRSVTLNSMSLLTGWTSSNDFTLPGHSLEGDTHWGAPQLIVSETYFSTMGTPVLLGRGLSATDTEGAARVVVVNQAFVRKYLPDENPVGQILNDGANWQIVGVCGDAKYSDIKGNPPPTVYYSFRQRPIGSFCFALRTALPPMSVVMAARKAVAAIDPDIPLAEITTQEQLRDQNIASEWMLATLCGALAGLALLLSCIGLYGLMAYNVARRTREFGIRMALGATRRNVAVPILREALLLAALGLAIGVPAALALVRFIKNQFYGVAPNDPLTLIGTGVLLVAVAILAAWIPARRAAKVDPMVALRCE
jgi:predicted permease